MYTIGELINIAIVNSHKNAIEFERYCKDERLNSIEIKREIYKSSRDKRNRVLKNFKILVKMIF
ncbi:hypothetical protein NSA50_16490 [Clostridium sp. DSM 100503]|uniref:hypothetical protein n=1 Tax=Clostridium sp. DSM 100503 TaxID=2963282 RepID=UPI002149DB94|nr:hypothetical protein [Clostridium sp. DSM 100503]MCR1952626.1 hypothetical protein [Clostridium sp. DSM 100503]